MPPFDESADVTQLLRHVKQGDHAAFEELWRLCFGQLVQLARRNLHSVSSGFADENDVIQSVMFSLTFVSSKARPQTPVSATYVLAECYQHLPLQAPSDQATPWYPSRPSYPSHLHGPRYPWPPPLSAVPHSPSVTPAPGPGVACHQ